jgi:para-aminobenzoate synthetase component 1
VSDAPQVLFDRGPLGDGSLFANPVRLIVAERKEEVRGAFAALEEAHAEGYWLAGYASYELGYVFCPKLEDRLPSSRNLPLIQFGAFEAPERFGLAPGTAKASLGPTRPAWDEARYTEAFQAVHDYIVAGDIYQANLTFPLHSKYAGPVDALYARLRDRQPVPHGALVTLGGPALLSRSPELFFSMDGQGRLTTRPMKGTAPRGATLAEDEMILRDLQTSSKNRAENLMIVDLLRNDVGRISEIGSVQVPELFSVERYATLFQMTSRITSQVRAETTLEELFTAVFPCGSVTGAPKIRAMEILNDLEVGPRGAYCGSIGWIAPDRSMEFNVAIRTVVCFEDGTAELHVGGGVVYDSTAHDEYAEAMLKSRFATLT